MNVFSPFLPYIRKTGEILTSSIAYLVCMLSAQMYFAMLIWFWAKASGQERLMAVSLVRQITPDSACRGLVLLTPPPLRLRCIEGCAEEVNRSFSQCKFRATFRVDPRTIEPTWPWALCTTWSMHQPHLGKTHTGMRVICLAQVLLICTHLHTLEHVLRDTHMAKGRHTCRDTGVNEMLSIHLVTYWKNH